VKLYKTVLNVGGHLSELEKYSLSPLKHSILRKEVAETGNVSYFYLIFFSFLAAVKKRYQFITVTVKI
jgi:hypothetical protein